MLEFISRKETIMDPIISGILQQQQAETALKVQMSVLQKSMDVQRNVGEILVGLIETAAPNTMQTSVQTPGLGENIDLFA
jgi:translation elongation factor EF-Ts